MLLSDLDSILALMVKLGSFTASDLYRAYYGYEKNEPVVYPDNIDDLDYMLSVMHKYGLLELSIDGQVKFYTLPDKS